MTTAEEELLIRVIPRAKQNQVGGIRAGRLVVRTTASPVDGQANAAVCRLVADHLGLRAAQIDIVTGHHSRDKTLRIRR